MAQNDIAPKTVPLDDAERLNQEYVTSGDVGALLEAFRSLPNFIDDVERDFGNAVYEAMDNDPALKAAIFNMKNIILSEGIGLLPAFEPPQEGGKMAEGYEAKYKKSVEVRDFVARQTDTLETPLEVTADEMLDAMFMGNRAAELVWEVKGGDYCLTALKPKRRRQIGYVVDPFNNVVGIIPVQPGMMMAIPSVILSDDKALRDYHVVPREKFMILTFRKRHGDPRGNSAYRAAYNGYQIKQLFWPDYIKQGNQFGAPSLWGTTPEDEGVRSLRDKATGVVIKDGDTNVRTVTAQEKLASALIKIRGGSCGAFPFGTKIELIEPKTDGEFFINAMDLLNREMTLAVLGSVRATMEAQHGSRADSETSQDLLGTAGEGGKRWLGGVIRSDVLYRIVAYNMGDEVAKEFTPRTSLSQTAREDIPSLVKAYGSAGWRPTTNQWAAISQRLGLPPPDIASGYLESMRADTEQGIGGKSDADDDDSKDNKSDDKDKSSKKPKE